MDQTSRDTLNSAATAAQQTRAVGSGPVSREVQWTPQRVLAGILYHVLESGMARSIEAASIANAAARLEAEWQPLPPPRAQWRVMSDADRLHWLLQVSRTAVDVDADRMATLRPIFP